MEIESYDKKRDILPKNVKISHFNIDILDKPETFSKQNFYQENSRNLKFHLLFENYEKHIRIKSYNSKYRGRIPFGIHKSARVNN